MYKFTYISRRSLLHSLALSVLLAARPSLSSYPCKIKVHSKCSRGRLVRSRRLLKVRAKSRQSRALPRDTPCRLSQSERLRALPFSFLPILRYIFSRTFSCTSPSSYYILPYLLVKSQPRRDMRERGGEGGERSSSLELHLVTRFDRDLRPLPRPI